MTKVFRILQLKGLGLPQGEIASSCAVSKSTASKLLKKASELGITLPLGGTTIADWLYRLIGFEVSASWISGTEWSYYTCRRNIFYEQIGICSNCCL